MHLLSGVLRHWAPVTEIEEAMKKKQFPLHVTGCVESQICHLADTLGNDYRYRIIVTYNEQRAREIYEDYSFFDKNVYLYPAKDVLFYQADVQANLIGKQRLEIIKQIVTGQSATIILTMDALMDKLPPVHLVREERLNLQPMDVVDVDVLKEKLLYLGYEKTGVVEMPGQFCIRGGIIDIYPLTEDSPYRVELWDDEVDSIRRYDADSQRSLEMVDEVNIFPACEMVIDKKRMEQAMDRIKKDFKKNYQALFNSFQTEQAARLKKTTGQILSELEDFYRTTGMESLVTYFYEETVSLLDYFDPGDCALFIDEYARIKERVESFSKEFTESMKHSAF